MNQQVGALNSIVSSIKTYTTDQTQLSYFNYLTFAIYKTKVNSEFFIQNLYSRLHLSTTGIEYNNSK